LDYIVSQLRRMDSPALHHVETAFDLLLEIRQLKEVVAMAQYGLDQYPRRIKLAYLEAQARWFDGDRSNANNACVRLLPPYSGMVERDRIEI